MPGSEQEINSSNPYQELVRERESLLEQRTHLLGGKKVTVLDESQLLAYCCLNKTLMENYWQGFERAKAADSFDEAVRDFQAAFEMGCVKACKLFNVKTNASAQSEFDFSSQPEENFIKALQFHLGIGVTQDQAQAVRFYTKAAEQGHAGAQFNLGYCYFHGLGTEKKDRIAVFWWQLAAQQGCAPAQNSLGVCYWCDNVKLNNNENEAVRLFELAAKQGHSIAQFNLGFCYQDGEGVEQDDNEAVRWYRLAAEQEYDKALEQLKTLSSSVPLAKYTAYLLEQNHAEAIKSALEEPDIESLFFTRDIVFVAKTLNNEESAADFFEALQQATKESNKDTNKLFVSALLALHQVASAHLIKDNKAVCYLMTELLGSIRLADVASSQIKDLMHFLCDLCDESNSTEVLHAIKLLWHRVKSLEMPMDDSALNQIIATKIVNKLFNNACSTPYTGDFSAQDLGILFMAYELRQPAKCSVELLNTLLSNTSLVTKELNSGSASPGNEQDRFFQPSPTIEPADVPAADKYLK